MDRKSKVSNHIITRYSGLTTFKLANLNFKDYSDPTSLWRSNNGFFRLVSSAAGNQKLRLCDVLNYSRQEPRQDPEKDVFHSVIFRMPTIIWRKLKHTQELSRISEQLSELHHKDFEGKIIGDRIPSYLIQPDTELNDGEACFVFGNMVYIPNKGDQLIYTLELGHKGDEQSFQELVWQVPDSNEPKAIGLYKNQEWLQIGLHPSPCTIDKVFWAGQEFTHLHIFKDSINQNKIVIYTIYNDTGSTDRDKSPDYEPFDANVELLNKNEVTTPIELRPDSFGKSGAQTSLELRIKRINPLTSTTQLNDTPNDESFTQSPWQTLIPDDSRKPKLKIEGLPLPRIDIDKIRSPDGAVLDTWSLHFDNHGKIHAQPAEDDSCMTLSASSDSSSLRYKKGSEVGFHELRLGFDDKNPLNLRAFRDDLTRYYFGVVNLLSLKSPISLDPGKVVTCGRDPNAEFCLSLFSQEGSPNCLNYTDGSTDFQFDKLTSGRHITVELHSDGKLMVTQISKSVDVYIVGIDNEYIETLYRRENKSYPIQSGQGVIVGNYLLRYENTLVPAQSDFASNEPAKNGGISALRQSKKLIGNALDEMTELLHALIKGSGIKTDRKDLGAICRAFLSFVDEVEPTSPGEACWRIIREACHSLRNAGSHFRTVVDGSTEMESSIMLESILSIERSIELFKNNTITSGFFNNRSEQITKITAILRNLRKNIIAEPHQESIKV